MTELADENKQFFLKVRDDYIDMIKEQIILEEKSRQYKLIIQLAEKYKQGEPAAIHEFIEMEKKQAEKDKSSLKTNINSLVQANDTLTSRKKFIPMLELEACILTTCELPKSLFPSPIQNIVENVEDSTKNPQAIKPISLLKDIDFGFADAKSQEENIRKLFNVPFQEEFKEFTNQSKELYKISENNFLTISHAQITVASLSFYPQNWTIFLSEFKRDYKEKPKNRYSLLYFLSVWFEMRPKHFLKMLPYLIDIVEDCNDGGLLVKHLRIIFDVSKRNMRFRFLPLDSVPPSFHLNYVQTSDYHKLISGNDVTTMQNSFKSNMLKRFEFTSKSGTPNANKNQKPNSNSNQTTNNKSQSNSNTKSEDKQTEKSNDNPNEKYPQQPNIDDFIDAILILLTTIQNALSFDCFIPNHIIDLNITNIKKYEEMNSINLERTHNLKNLFTPNEFNYWKNKINTIEVAQKGAAKLSAILHGFSDWVVDTITSQKKDIKSVDVFSSIKENVISLIEGVAKYDRYIAQKYLTIDIDAIKNHEIINSIPSDFLPALEKYSKTSNKDTRLLDIPECFFSTDQTLYKAEKANIYIDKEKDHNYKTLMEKTYDILVLLEMRPKLDTVHMKNYDFESVGNKEFHNHNEVDQRYVDPWAIRIMFYNFTRFIFDTPNDFKFEV